jgi:hypothetical protein
MKKYFFLLILAMAGCAYADDDPHFSNDELPAFVQEIGFSGATLNANSSVTFGAWRVRFNGSSMPIVVGYNGMAKYTIYNLTAHNDVTGDLPCMIYYIDAASLGDRKRGVHEYQWNLGVLNSAWNPTNYVSDSNHPDIYKIISIPTPDIKRKQ